MDHWQEAESLFEAALDLPLDRRARFLGEACRGDAELLRDVEDLLAADSKSGAGILAAIEREAQSLFGQEGVVGSRIGAYRLVGEIGRGGMSTVYLAVRDDDQFQKQVAIKLIRRGMDTQDVLDRFRHERQILANLEHPYIARLLDGGTAPDGRPFLVMEYLQGEPLTAFCRNRGLDLRARCRLFLKICEAVSFAHRNLVVHRDLKPGNILVAADGSPKLLDFGVAKLLDKTDSGQTATAVALRPMTPDYASPEQFRGEAITTAADVYSLGAILYEMLSEQRPHRFSSYGLRELERVICEAEPARPSECAASSIPWRAQLRGDLDAIVAKAMRKEPGQRYASVDHFAVDLSRYLEGWPVQAHQGDIAYRGRKFLRRNRAPIAVSALLAATLVGGAIAATMQARRAERERLRALANQALAEDSQKEARRQATEAERQRGLADEQRRQAETEKALAETQRQIADRRFEQVHELAGKFLFDFNDSIAKLPGSTTARKMVVETGLKYFDTLVQGAQGNRALLEEIARGYDRLGDVQGNFYEANLGDMPGALQTYRKAQAIRGKIADPSPAVLGARIMGNLKIAEIMLVRGDTAAAEPVLQNAFALARSHAADDSIRTKLSDVYSHYGDLKARAGVYTEAVAPYSKTLEILMSQDPSENRNYKISVAHSKLAEAYVRTERAPESLPHVRASMDFDQPRLQANPDNLTLLRRVYLDYVLLSYIYLSDSGQDLDAGKQASAFETAAALADRMAAADAKDVRTISDVRTAQIAWADFLRDHNEPGAALIHYRRGLEAAEKQAAASPTSGSGPLLMAHHRLARGLAAAGNPEEALDHVRQAETYLAVLEKQNPGLPAWVAWRTNLYRARALAYSKLEKWPEAIAEYRAEITALQDLRKRSPEDAENLYGLRMGNAELADCYAAMSRWTEAAQAMQGSLDALREVASRRALRADEEQARSSGLAKLASWQQK